MVLTKAELIPMLEHEVRLLLHLMSKVDPAKLDYRPTPKQRSTLELLQYLTIFGPIHMRGATGATFSMPDWGNMWKTEEAIAKTRDLDQIKEALSKQPALFAEILNACSDEYLREEFEMFGGKSSRGRWIVSLVLCHFAAYRMQLFLYLKSSGREELNTLNLWVGVDNFARP